MTEAGKWSKQFNAGSDARIAGTSVLEAPRATLDYEEVFAWTSGWRHCDENWGKDAGNRDVLRLPPRN